MFEGETLLSGAARSCKDCGSTHTMRVLLSGAGYYIGSACDCGPNTRESDYYLTREEAEKDLPSFEAALAGTGPVPSAARS